ncbi:MAG: hypothetical protein KC731_41575 [Myxococcales bacterium]|nr:hypothetical protein [Myxococcales bacterium]
MAPAAKAPMEAEEQGAPTDVADASDDGFADTVDRAAFDFERAERAFAEAAGDAGGRGDGVEPPATPPPLPPGPEASGETPAPIPADDRGARLSQAQDRCTRSCKAFGSMRRAAGRLCELTGPSDPRCDHVLERVRDAHLRLAQHCPGCAGDDPR